MTTQYRHGAELLLLWHALEADGDISGGTRLIASSRDCFEGQGFAADVASALMSPRRRHFALICLAFVAFISLGLPDGVLGVAWPSVRGAFGLPVSRLGLLLICGTAGYLVVSSLSGPIERRVGVGWLLVGSTATAGLGLSIFAISPTWWALLPAMLLGGLGAGGIDSGLNSFAAERFSPRVMSWLHACYGIGATLGPLLMTAVLMLEQSWRWGYAVLALVMLVLACFFAGTLKLWKLPAGHEHAEPTARAAMLSTLRLRLAWVHIGLFMCYCGVEVSAGQLMYTLFTESRGVKPEIAGPVVGGYWAALTLGRIFFGAVATHWSPKAILRFAATTAPMAIALIWWNVSDWASFAGLWMLGFALAPIFPMMVSATPVRLGKAHGPNAVGFQMSAASLGSATLPGLGAILMRQAGLESLGLYMVGLALCVLLLQEASVRLSKSPPGV